MFIFSLLTSHFEFAIASVLCAIQDLFGSHHLDLGPGARYPLLFHHMYLSALLVF